MDVKGDDGKIDHISCACPIVLAGLMCCFQPHVVISIAISLLVPSVVNVATTTDKTFVIG